MAQTPCQQNNFLRSPAALHLSTPPPVRMSLCAAHHPAGPHMWLGYGEHVGGLWLWLQNFLELINKLKLSLICSKPYAEVSSPSLMGLTPKCVWVSFSYSSDGARGCYLGSPLQGWVKASLRAADNRPRSRKVHGTAGSVNGGNPLQYSLCPRSPFMARHCAQSSQSENAAAALLSLPRSSPHHHPTPEYGDPINS